MAHSSHILQPLDLRLNRLVKDRYKKEYPTAERRLLHKEMQQAQDSDANVSPPKPKRARTTKENQEPILQREHPQPYEVEGGVKQNESEGTNFISLVQAERRSL